MRLTKPLATTNIVAVQRQIYSRIAITLHKSHTALPTAYHSQALTSDESVLVGWGID